MHVWFVWILCSVWLMVAVPWRTTLSDSIIIESLGDRIIFSFVLKIDVLCAAGLLIEPRAPSVLYYSVQIGLPHIHHEYTVYPMEYAGLLCFVLLWLEFSSWWTLVNYISIFFRVASVHWHWDNHMIATVPVKQPWKIWVKLTTESPNYAVFIKIIFSM